MNRFLSDVERIVASSDNISTSLQRVARALIPDLADFCFVFLVKGRDVPCVASAHTTRDGERALRAMNRVYRVTLNDPVSTVAHVIRSGRPILRSQIKSEPHAPLADLRVFTLHQRLGARSALVVPIGHQPRVLGALSCAYAHSGRHYTTPDLARARRVASLIALLLRRRARTEATTTRLPIVPRRSIRLRARA